MQDALRCRLTSQQPSPNTLQKFQGVIRRQHTLLSQKLLDNVMHSMKNCCKACILVRGDCTHYYFKCISEVLCILPTLLYISHFLYSYLHLFFAILHYIRHNKIKILRKFDVFCCKTFKLHQYLRNSIEKKNGFRYIHLSYTVTTSSNKKQMIR